MDYFIDSNIFLRVIVEEDKKSFLECKNLFQAIEDRKLRWFSSNIVLAEVVWVLASFYKLKKEKILAGLAGIRNLRGFNLVDKFQFDLALRLYSKSQVKFVDCLIASVPQISAKAWTVVSYDKDFDKLGVSRVEPDEVLRKWVGKDRITLRI
ncbi:MAG: PIN domain-containing protein [Patescibacteria group bacterium]